jgi:hypothetical protein
VLQPGVLALLESPATSELLHGVYLFLAGSSSNPEDLGMNLVDMRMGLRHAAGRRTLQEHQREHQLRQRQRQQQQARRLPGMRRSSSISSSSNAGGGSSKAPCAFTGSTDSSGWHATEAAQRSLHTHACSAADADSSWSPGSSSSSSSGRAFQVPLHKLAAFIRAAKLLPRLLDKYILQLQLQGQEQRGSSSVEALPVMPCLQLSAPAAATAGGGAPPGGASHTGGKRR